MEVFENASAYYVVAIAFTANTIIVKKQTRWSLRTELLVHTMIWLVSLSLGVIPLISYDVTYRPSGSLFLICKM